MWLVWWVCVGVTSPHLKFRTSDFIQQRGNSAKHRGRTGGCVLKRMRLDLPQMERRHFRQENFAIFQTWERLWSFVSFPALLEQMAGACACPQNETLMPDTCTPTASFSSLSCSFSLPLQQSLLNVLNSIVEGFWWFYILLLSKQHFISLTHGRSGKKLTPRQTPTHSK